MMSNAILHSSQYQNYRSIRLIVIHCSATRCNRPFPVEAVVASHIERGFAHRVSLLHYPRRGGASGRPVYQEGAHATGWNKYSLGVCYEGGLNARGQPADTRTDAQRETLRRLLLRLKTDYPKARIVGHRELGAPKECPCFDAGKEYVTLMPNGGG